MDGYLRRLFLLVLSLGSIRIFAAASDSLSVDDARERIEANCFKICQQGVTEGVVWLLQLTRPRRSAITRRLLFA
jgi:hypothetical protein